MIVTHLSLGDFRNYETAEVELEPGPNLFVGRNGQGKTNLVESLGYLSTLGSHRVSTDQALIRHGADSGVIRARLRHGERAVLVEVQLNRSAANRAQLNRAGIKPRELPRHVPTVLFAPEDLALVRGEPGVRRRFLDQLLVQIAPRLSGVMADYERVLRQRNSLLKSARAARVASDQLTTLEVWDDRLVELGSELILARRSLVERLTAPTVAAYADVAGGDHRVELTSRLSILGAQPDDEPSPQLDDGATALDRETAAAAFRSALAHQRRSELERGLTLVGPHRDDLVLGLNGLPARGYASHGESWSLAVALRLGSAAVLRETSVVGDPVIMLDDVFAELDERRRDRLAVAIADYEQVLITAAVEGDVPAELRRHTVRIEGGRVLESGEAPPESAGGVAP